MNKNPINCSSSCFTLFYDFVTHVFKLPIDLASFILIYHSRIPSLFQVLEGAVDSSMLITNLLPKTFTTRFLRFHPKSWVGGIVMKVEVFADETGTAQMVFY